MSPWDRDRDRLVTYIADHGGAVIFAVWIVSLAVTPPRYFEFAWIVPPIVTATIVYWANGGTLSDSEPTPVEQLQTEWVEGEISQAEFERRLEFALDDDRKVVVAELTPIDNVGEKRARRLSRQLSTVEAVRRADRSELLEVDGIGPETADEIRDHFES